MEKKSIVEFKTEEEANKMEKNVLEFRKKNFINLIEEIVLERFRIENDKNQVNISTEELKNDAAVKKIDEELIKNFFEQKGINVTPYTDGKSGKKCLKFTIVNENKFDKEKKKYFINAIKKIVSELEKFHIENDKNQVNISNEELKNDVAVKKIDEELIKNFFEQKGIEGIVSELEKFHIENNKNQVKISIEELKNDANIKEIDEELIKKIFNQKGINVTPYIDGESGKECLQFTIIDEKSV